MSSCLSGGATAYGFDLDIVVNKPSSSPTSSSRSTHSSPSSTLSEACNSPLAISTKRARAPRKRPNQTYNEAAALLSTVYPNIFPSKNLPKLSKKQSSPLNSFSEPHSDLLSHFPAIAETSFSLLYEPTPSTEQRPTSSSERCSSACLSPTAPSKLHEEDDDFDAESILDEEIGEGIDSIMGNLSFKSSAPESHQNPFSGYGIGGILKLRQGTMRRALKRGDEGEWWRSPTVEVLKIAPKLKQSLPEKKKKKKVQKVERIDKTLKMEDNLEREEDEEEEEEREKIKPSLCLKLNYEDVLRDWSNRGSPFSGDSEAINNLKDIELFPEAASGGVREASVLRYKEKRRTRLFSKKIRYQVRKTNAERRPRMKASGRFVRRPSSLASS